MLPIKEISFANIKIVGNGIPSVSIQIKSLNLIRFGISREASFNWLAFLDFRS